MTTTKSDLEANNYSLDLTYLEEEDQGYEVPMVKLGDVCDFISGKSFNVKEFNYDNNGLRVIKVKILKNTVFNNKKQI